MVRNEGTQNSARRGGIWDDFMMSVLGSLVVGGATKSETESRGLIRR